MKAGKKALFCLALLSGAIIGTSFIGHSSAAYADWDDWGPRGGFRGGPYHHAGYWGGRPGYGWGRPHYGYGAPWFARAGYHRPPYGGWGNRPWGGWNRGGWNRGGWGGGWGNRAWGGGGWNRGGWGGRPGWRPGMW